MTWTRPFLAALLALGLVGGAHGLAAQSGLGGGGLRLYGFGPRLGENVDLAIQHGSQLGLSQDQIVALRELRAGIQSDVEPLEARINDLRARILAGEVPGPQGVAQLQGLWVEYDAAAAPYRAGVAGILTAAQHQALQGIMFESWTGPAWELGWGAGVRPVPGRGAGWAVGGGARWTGYPGVGWGRGPGAGWGGGRGAAWGGMRGAPRWGYGPRSPWRRW